MAYEPLPAFAAYSGSRQPKAVLVGEAWGESEDQLRKPFVGESGKELWRMLGEAMPLVAPELHAEISALHRYGLAWAKRRDEWLAAASLGMTNVLALRPPSNKLEALCASKAEVGKSYEYPSIAHGKYLRAEFLPEVDRLFNELGALRPHLVIALGNTACWALLRATNIGSIRGTIAPVQGLRSSERTGSDERQFLGSLKCLPTYHPAGVLRQWSWRTIVVADLMKASREAEFPEIRRPSRQVLVNPTLDEIGTWVHETITKAPWTRPVLACDIETGAGQIKCVGFARSKSEALVIPFVDQSRPDYSYWPTPGQELAAWKQVAALLECSIPKVFQNGLYDLQYLLRLGLTPRNCTEDTMLLHHSLFPEMQKGLGFLGSVYTNESSWKLMRRQRPDSEKRDE